MPDRSRLEALPADDWAVLLRLARAVLLELDAGADTAARADVRGRSTGQLAGGRGRARLSDLLASDAELWERVVAGSRQDAEARDIVAALLDAAAAGQDGVDRQADGSDGQQQQLRRRAERDRRRLVEVRGERDELRRRLADHERRVTRAEDALGLAEAELDRTRSELDELRSRLQAAERDRERAVAREGRRRDAEVSRLRQELSELRREREQERVERSRVRAEETAKQRPATPTRSHGPPRLVPGRPSRLPGGVVPGTREATELYLHRGRLVLIDGYNVTLQRHEQLDLEQQRTWLIQAVGNLARRRGIRPIVVFDGAAADGRGSRTRHVEVRFSPPNVTADDEIVLAVEGTDEPVVVVTDDRELRARVVASGADTILSQELLWLL